MIETKSFFDMLKGTAGPTLAPNGNEIQPAWQQEMLKQFDPAEQKKNAIRQALLSAARGMVSTPGNFGRGLSEGIVSGAEAYGKTKQQGQTDRVGALKSVFDAQTSDRDSKMARIKQMLDAARGVNSEDREQTAATDLQKYRQDSTKIAQQRADQDARRIESRTGGQADHFKITQAIEESSREYQKILTEQGVEGEEFDAAVEKHLLRLRRRFRINDDGTSSMPAATQSITPDDDPLGILGQ